MHNEIVVDDAGRLLLHETGAREQLVCCSHRRSHKLGRGHDFFLVLLVAVHIIVVALLSGNHFDAVVEVR